MNNLFTNKHPHSPAAASAFHIDVGVKILLLYSVFGRNQVDQMLNEHKKSPNSAYLNSFGANVHLLFVGGNVDNPIYNFRICGHHPGEAAETLIKLADANHGEYLVKASPKVTA